MLNTLCDGLSLLATAAAHTPPAARRRPDWHPPRTVCGSTCSLVDDLGDLEHDLVGEGNAQLVGGLEVHHEVEGHRLLDGKVGGFGALEDAVYVVRGAAVHAGEIGAVRHQAPRLDEYSAGSHRGQPVRGREIPN